MKFNMATATTLYFCTKHDKSAADWKNFAGMLLVATGNRSCDQNQKVVNSTWQRSPF